MMKKVVLQEFISIDGLVTGPNDTVDFIPESTQGDATFGREQVALMDGVDTLVLGRVTYQMFAGYWPHVTEGPEKEFADKFNAASRMIFSKTLSSAPWGDWKDGTIVRGNAVEEVAKLKRQSGAAILISGSVSIAQALIGENMVDEYRLVLCPVVLRSGRSLFDADTRSIPLELVSAKTLDRGAVSLIYKLRNAAG